jgi:multiple sugar transport system substrate-binding protein
MKKIFSILFVMMLMVMVSACRTAEPDEQEEITLTYAAWNLGDANSANPNLERLMLDAFEREHPNITVNVIERPKMPDPNNEENQLDTPWNEFLTARASEEQLPDVFFVDNIPLSISNEWLYDLSTIAGNDQEFNNVSADITNAARYGNRLYALPYSVNYFGYVVNKSVFDKANLDAPEFGEEWTSFISKAKAAASHRTGGQGTVGFEGVEHIMHWYPAQVNEDLGWFTYDGSKFNLTDPSFRQAVEIQQALYADKTFVLEALTGEEQADFFGSGWKWGEGRHAVKWDGSWVVSGLRADMERGGIATFDYDFIGTPAVDGTQRIPINIDFVAVGADTENPQEAYELAKWMGYGKEGYLTRVNLSTTTEGIQPVNFAPLQSQDEELMDAFFSLYEGFDGFRQVVEHGQYIVEPVKYLPGYNQARYNGQYDTENNMWSILNKLMRNEVNFADHISRINQRANEEYQKAYQQIQDIVEG